MSNIAEGYKSHTQRLFIAYLSRAKGSAGEFRAQLYIASDRSYLLQDDFDRLLQLVEMISRQFAGFIKYLKNSPISDRIRQEESDYHV